MGTCELPDVINICQLVLE